jgi:hypothetical protein
LNAYLANAWSDALVYGDGDFHREILAVESPACRGFIGPILKCNAEVSQLIEHGFAVALGFSEHARFGEVEASRILQSATIDFIGGPEYPPAALPFEECGLGKYVDTKFTHHS